MTDVAGSAPIRAPSGFVDDAAADGDRGFRALIGLGQDAAHPGKNGARRELTVSHLIKFGLSPLPVELRYRNAETVSCARVHLHIALGIRNHLTPYRQVQGRTLGATDSVF